MKQTRSLSELTVCPNIPVLTLVYYAITFLHLRGRETDFMVHVIQGMIIVIRVFLYLYFTPVKAAYSVTMNIFRKFLFSF